MDNTQQPKPDPKGKAIASLRLAVIAILLPIMIWGIGFLYGYIVKPGPMTEEWSLLLMLSLILLFICIPLSILLSIIAVILGILGLKSTKSNYAIIGIVLSTLFWIMLSLGIYYALGY